ncbi:lytic murein transglycosylase [Lysinibacillus fusiformis]|uniref:lytic transglycosylase domain-containing protein n=1 Tax=Lysinibacillus fusiformis TaxID=28031 RepID=UPI003CFD5A0F
MRKRLLIPVLCSFLFVLQNPIAKAEELDLPTLQNEQKEVKKQLKEAIAKQDDLSKKEQKELVKLNQRYSSIVAKRKALEKAESFLNGEETKEETKKRFSDTIQNWSKVVVPFRSVPVEYKPIYVAAGERYGVDWKVLAAIHSIETSFSNISTMVSSVGAIGHMQFMPATFKAYGVDGNGDGQISPWNIEDAIYSAANYLAANNFKNDQRKAIWHYNHADWYVNDVLETAASFIK